MTNEQIDHLVAARNRITDVTADYFDTRAVAHIDAVLSDVPLGQRPDVDALLGRRATPPGWFVNPAVTLEQMMSAQHDQLDQSWKHIKGDCAL